MDKSQIKFMDEFVYNEIFVQNVYGLSREEMTNTAVLDIGGQYGFFALFSAENGAKQIISVEPNFQNLGRYLVNTANINTKVICAAAYSKNIITTIDNESGRSKLKNGNQLVATVTFNELFNLLDTNLNLILKVDIEGSEYELLYNVPPELLRKFKIIVMETHNHIYKEPPYLREDDSEKLKNYIAGLGFNAHTLGFGWFTENTTNIPPGYMYKFVNNKI